jgi:hypothetical protein
MAGLGTVLFAMSGVYFLRKAKAMSSEIDDKREAAREE